MQRRPPASVLLVLLVACIAFGGAVAFRAHGFSLSAWHEILDLPAGGEQTEVLLGKARTIRGDDYLVLLPLALAQSRHEPPFPVVNENIGLGQNMLVTPSPVAHPLAAFRPELLGFFLGDDVGLAWLWWFRVLGLFVIWFCVLLTMSGARVALSVSGSLLIVLSPFFQFHAFNSAPVAIAAGLAYLAAVGLLRARRPAAILACGAALGWAGGCFLLTFYPAFQVVLGYLFLTLVAANVWAGRREPALRERLRVRLAAGAIAALIPAAVVVLLLRDAAEPIGLMQGTVYPGQRLALGGGLPIWQVFNSDLLVARYVRDYRGFGLPLESISDTGFFWLLLPVIHFGIVMRALVGRARPDPLTLALAVYASALLAYAVIGVPEWLARATLLRRVVSHRVMIGVGIADALLLVRFLSLDRPALSYRRGIALGGAVLWAALLAGCAHSLRAALPELELRHLALAVLLNGAVAYLVLARRHEAWVLAVMVAALGLSTLWFNPLARGGSAYLRENDLARKILEVDRASGGETTWATYGSRPVANLFRMLGVRSLDGVHFVPQLALWRRLDAEGRFIDRYNRYAHVSFERRIGEADRFGVPYRDALTVALEPSSRAMQELGVTHVLLVTRQRARLASGPGSELLHSNGWQHLFRVWPEAAPP